MSLDNPPDTVYCNTSRHILSGHHAFRDAERIYNAYSGSPDNIELLGTLSALVRDVYPNGKLLHSSLTTKLESASLLEPGPSKLEQRLSRAGIVAVNMVGVETNGSDFETWLEEPFASLCILGELHANATQEDKRLAGDAYRS